MHRTPALRTPTEKLENEHVLIISGPPGVGKDDTCRNDLICIHRPTIGILYRFGA